MIRQDLGFYSVGTTLFDSKVAALIDGTKRDIHPKWHFHNDFFDHVDWSQEPIEDIYDLYRERALQLREKYDYLVLMYSGGSDSQTILDVCIKHGIRIDEILVVWAPSLDSTYTPDAADTSWDNVQSEWDFTIQPRLNYLSQHFPWIKITVHDWAKTATEIQLPDDFIADRNHNFTPFAQARWDLTLIPGLADRLSTDQKVGVIFGTDKPRICIKDGAYRFYFLDIVTSAAAAYSASFVRNPINIELFYWSPDSWRILIKQAHLLMKFFDSHPAMQQFIEWPVSFPAHRQFYETASRAIIYPGMNLRFFQAQKYQDLIFGFDTLLFKTGHAEKLKAMQQDNFAHLQKIIDPKYFHKADGGGVSLTGFFTGMWPIKYLNPA